MPRYWTAGGVRSGRPSSAFVVWLVVAVLTSGVSSTAFALVHRPAPGGPPALPLPSVAPRATPLRVLPLGDSITLGYDSAELSVDGGGYRSVLDEELVHRDGRQVEFVGSQHSGVPELDHEGHAGWRIDQIRAIVDATLAEFEPDVVLLHIGSNDVGQHFRLDRAPDRLRELATRICTVRPQADLVVASIIPIGSLEPLIDAYNARIPAIVGGLQAAGCRAHYVDINPVVAATELRDGVHPSAAGYTAIAQVWLPQVEAAYAGPRPAPNGGVDDDVVAYRGDWRHETARPGAFWSDEHASDATGDTASWTFEGGGIGLFGSVGPDGGIAAVRIDDGPESMVDYYSPEVRDQVEVHRTPPVEDGRHTVTVRVVGDASPASSGRTVTIDRLAVTAR